MALRSRARTIVGRSYALSKRYAQRRMQRSGSRRRIIVFTMGKTGSTAIARALSDVTGEYVFQVFRLRPDGLAGAERRYRERSRNMKASKTAAATSAFPGATHLWESAFLLEHRATPSAPWHVICSVREPIAQAVSAFFHAQARERSGASEVPPDALRDRLVAERWLEHPAQWFERELTPSLGIDVFAHPFDTNAATAVIERGSVKLLLLRQEDLDRAPRALADFLQLGSPVQLSRRNDAASRHDAERYQAFLESVHLPADIVDATYASTFSRHFYSDVELAQLRSRWTAYRTKEATNKRGMR